MYSDSRFIIIAGTARNVGKTTLACELIRKISVSQDVIGVKFISLKKDGYKHGHHTNINTYEIFEETSVLKGKDTSKMINAGAIRSFFIVSQENYLEEAINEFSKNIKKRDIVIAESASLRNIIKPKYFIIVDKERAVNKKTYINALIPLSDYYLDSDKDYKFKNFIDDFSL